MVAAFIKANCLQPVLKVLEVFSHDVTTLENSTAILVMMSSISISVASLVRRPKRCMDSL